MSGAAMVDEFDRYARWTADAVVELGHDHALPAACRGSGSPAVLDWLTARMSLGPGVRLLDSGAGVGGPAHYAASTTGALPVLAEPMPGACEAAARLFGHRVVVADGAALPFGPASCEASWSLGVLCTVEDKTRHLAELARVTRPGGPVGVLVFVRTVPRLPHQPEGNEFPDDARLEDAVRRAGLEIEDRAWAADLPSAPGTWSRAVEAVDRVVERDHGDDDAFVTARRQSAELGELMDDGLVAGRLLVARATRAGGPGTRRDH